MADVVTDNAKNGLVSRIKNKASCMQGYIELIYPKTGQNISILILHQNFLQ